MMLHSWQFKERAGITISLFWTRFIVILEQPHASQRLETLEHGNRRPFLLVTYKTNGNHFSNYLGVSTYCQCQSEGRANTGFLFDGQRSLLLLLLLLTVAFVIYKVSAVASAVVSAVVSAVASAVTSAVARMLLGTAGADCGASCRQATFATRLRGSLTLLFLFEQQSVINDKQVDRRQTSFLC
jgi:hypothetical protein